MIHPLIFVRQHHMTCAPATLTALATFWGQAVDHLELARLICYDGTPDHEERAWAESHGWSVREFRVTWEAARTLLDAGLPFALNTTATRSAHLQAVFGYDARLGSLHIRDPYRRASGEWLAEHLENEQAPYGPRGMVMVPALEAHRLAGLTLPDTALYDHYFRLRRALHGQDRALAAAALAELTAAAPSHRLTLQARRALAFYDGDEEAVLEVVRALRALDPTEPNLRLDELRSLRVLHRSQEADAVAGALAAARPVQPLFLTEAARHFLDDSRNLPRALRLARQATRRQPAAADVLLMFAEALRASGEVMLAARLHRLAATTGDKDEGPWRAWFEAAMGMGRADEVLVELRARVRAYGAKSSLPVRTLFHALSALDRDHEALEALETALLQRPEDATLLLFAADQFARFGREEDARQLLARAQPRAQRSAWLRSAAQIAGFRLASAEALPLWRELAALRPLDEEAHREIASALAAAEGLPAAVAYIRALVQQHPHYIPFHTILAVWLREAPAVEALDALDQLLVLTPRDAWTHRERALVLERLGRMDDALAAARTGHAIQPRAVSSVRILAELLASTGDRTGAERLLLDALEQGPADGIFIDRLFRLAQTSAEACALFSRLERLLETLPQPGALFLHLQAQGRDHLPPEEMLERLRHLAARRPEHWAAISALLQHCVELSRLQEAKGLAESLTRAFPSLPRAWVDLAEVHRAAGDAVAELEALRHALQLNPGWLRPALRQAAVLESIGQLDEARSLLRRLAAAQPREPIPAALLARFCGEHGPADEVALWLLRATQLDPGYDFAWDLLASAPGATPALPRPLALAREFAAQRPHEAAVATRLARECLRIEQWDEAIQAAAQAATLQPSLIDAHDLHAELLARAGQHDAALAACRPAFFGDQTPLPLRGRAAWITHQRGAGDAAITEMRALLAQHPSYVWGWRCLLEWLDADKRHRDVIAAAERLHWLSPHDAMPHGYRGAAQLELGDRTSARAAFERAVALDPRYHYATRQLLQLHLNAREFDAAEHLLARLRTYASPSTALIAEFQLAFARDDTASLGRLVPLLVQTPGYSSEGLEELLSTRRTGDFVLRALEIIGRTLAHPQFAPAALERWSERAVALSCAPALRHIWRLPMGSEIRREAFVALLNTYAKQKLRWVVRWQLCFRSREIRQHPATWGAVTYALASTEDHLLLILWAHDWRRPDAEAWMLFNLILALRSGNWRGSAARVVTHALTLPAGHVHARLHAMAAYLAAEQDQPEQARALLAAATPPPHETLFAPLLHLAQARLDGVSAAPSPAWDRLHARRADFGADRYLRRSLRRTLLHLARQARSPGRVLRSCGPLHSASLTPRSFWQWLVLAWVGLAILRGLTSR